MANSTSTCQMPETDITALKEAFCAQQLLLQKLYIELDEEREASASAASEALSMILRLQQEKSVVKMEASQYKRMAEEKMCIAEEYLAAYEDVICQKEMEIASLEFQIQAYRYKMLSLGCTDLGVSENKCPENLLLQRSDTLLGEMGNLKVRRLNSMPARLKDSSQKKSPIERQRSGIPRLDLIPRIVEETIDEEVHFQSSDLEKKSENSAGGDFNSHWEQIRKLAKEIADCKGKSANFESESRSYSLQSQVITSPCCDATKGKLSAKMDQVNESENSVEREAVVYSDCPSSVPDVFEVTTKKCKACGHEEKEKCKLILEGENRIVKLDLVPEETLESHIKKDETDEVKKMLLNANHEKGLSKPRDGMSVDCVRPTTDVDKFQAEFQQLSQRIERLEGERNIARNEISQGGEEELNLLNGIPEQLNSIESEVRSWKSKKSPPPDDSSLVTIMEAMLYFWI